MSSSVHTNNKTRSILVLGKDFVQGIDNTIIYAEKIYSTNVTLDHKKFYLSLHYNGDDRYLFVNGKEIIKFKAKIEIKTNAMYLGNISGQFSDAYTKKTGLYGTAYDVSADYKPIAVDDILDIYKYLMEKNNIK